MKLSDFKWFRIYTVIVAFIPVAIYLGVTAAWKDGANYIKRGL